MIRLRPQKVMKYAALVMLVVVGNALLARAQYQDVLKCDEQFSKNSRRPHISGTNNVYNQGIACYKNRNSDRPVVDNIRFSDTSRWANICGYWERAVQCLQDLAKISEEDAVARLENRTDLFIKEANIELWGSMASSIYHFPKRVCQNYEVKSELSALMNTDLSCLKRSDHVDFYGCYEILDCELSHTFFESGTENIPIIKIIERVSAGAVKCMRNVIQNTACGADAKGLLRFISELQMPSFVDADKLNVTGAPVVNLGSDKRCTLGVYGDPHLLYCNARRLETCAAPGEKVYLSNSYMDIRGTNVELSYSERPKPTVVRKIAITFRSADGTTHVTTYTADNGTLPRTFENGKTTIGEGYNQVSIAASGDYRVTFIQSSIGAILSLRRWRNNYFFTLRISRSIAKASHGLLGTGCPPSQIIKRNVNQPRLKRAATREECGNECQRMVTETQMVEICKYDCFVTGELAFVNMTAAAVEDRIEVRRRDTGLIESATRYEDSLKPKTTTSTTPTSTTPTSTTPASTTPASTTPTSTTPTSTTGLMESATRYEDWLKPKTPTSTTPTSTTPTSTPPTSATPTSTTPTSTSPTSTTPASTTPTQTTPTSTTPTSPTSPTSTTTTSTTPTSTTGLMESARRYEGLLKPTRPASTTATSTTPTSTTPTSTTPTSTILTSNALGIHAFWTLIIVQFLLTSKINVYFAFV